MPTPWSDEDLKTAAAASAALLREQRLLASDAWTRHVDASRAKFIRLLSHLRTGDPPGPNDVTLTAIVSDGLSEALRYLARIGLTEVIPSSIGTLVKGPQAGQFCGECLLGERKADVVVRLPDTRLLAIECKVSNSATNSVKRLDNDAAVKAEYWLKQFGVAQVVPAAVLSGVFNPLNLEQAQQRGLSLFWAHDLQRLGSFIEGASP